MAFEPSGEVLANPERGFYRAAPGDLDAIDPQFLATAYREGHRLIYARINLEPYRTADLPADYLTRLTAGFAAARKAGVKLIVRATYNYPRGETGYQSAQDAPLPQVLRHLEQLRPVLHAERDVIAFVQAGFVGAWGEWHTSSNALTEPAARTAIKDALLAAVPEDRAVQFRYPPYIREWAPRLPGPAGAEAAAWRIGFHNDCFLASQTDVGTYNEDAKVRAGEQDYNDRLGDIAPFGGETCNPADDPGAQPRTRCSDIQGEGARYNLTYLNDGYYRTLFHDAWAKEGCLADVDGRMGYRLRLIEAAFADTAVAGEPLRAAISIFNEGWARPANPRLLELLLRPRSGKPVRLPVPDADARQWLPGQVSRISLAVPLPAELPAGAYELLIALPDASPRLHDDPRYAVRPANADNRGAGQGWDARIGAFRLGVTITVAPRG